MPELKIEDYKVVYDGEWSRFVSEVYGRPYDLQQQDGGMSRCHLYVEVPVAPEDIEIFKEDCLGDISPCDEKSMCVDFERWLSRDPEQLVPDDVVRQDCSWVENKRFNTDLWWERNFYPHIDILANDLYEKGFLPAGQYLILVDW